MEVLVDLVEELGRGEPALLRADEESEVLGHRARFNGFDDGRFEGLCKFIELWVLVELRTVLEAAGPSKD